ncbi:MAG: hypothetical protein KAK04_11930, partial [Cyclobacteriaceae bacterium]|nr:hypothetical protein [Cyclobacteriaceae bacterium]
MKNKVKLFTLFTFLIAVFWSGCQEQVMSPDSDSFKIQQQLSSMSFEELSECKKVADLWAGAGKNDLGKGEDIGDVNLYFEYGKIKVDYVIDKGSDWLLMEAHLWIGTEDDLGSFPKNAAPGSFPYAVEEFSEPYPKSHTFVIDPVDLGLDEEEICGAQLYLATHAVVQKLNEVKEECIDFESYTDEFTEISNQEAGISFFMADAALLESKLIPTFELNIGDVIDVDPTGEYPIIGVPQT